MWEAAGAGDNRRVAELLASRADLEERHAGWTPLMKAAEAGHTHVMHMLLNRRADLGATNARGRSALSFAMAPSQNTMAVSIAAVRLLVDARADPHARDAENRTPFDRARTQGRYEFLELLRQ